MTEEIPAVEALPVLIIGAGITGLLLAQQLRKSNVPFEIFERDNDLITRGLGWGMTLHWSLPALSECLPDHLLAELPYTYVDRAAVEHGASSTFPFFDLNTGELKSSTPKAPETQRVRVSRERLRGLLAQGVDIQWGKSFRDVVENEESVTVTFEDGSTSRGRLLIGCDGSHSRVRRKVWPDEHANYQLPIRLFGFTLRKSAKDSKPIRDLDPLFLQGTASKQNSYMFISLLEAPGEGENEGENEGKNEGEEDKADYVYQICISRHLNEEERETFKKHPSTNELRIDIVDKIAMYWAEPFRSFVRSAIGQAEVKQLDLDDFLPQKKQHTSPRLLLIGDALHAMTMYRGEGANHGIVDVLDFKKLVLPNLHSDRDTLQTAIHKFEHGVVERTSPAVLASRQACLDAHDWTRLFQEQPSPLLTRREMRLKFNG